MAGPSGTSLMYNYSIQLILIIGTIRLSFLTIAFIFITAKFCTVIFINGLTHKIFKVQCLWIVDFVC